VTTNMKIHVSQIVLLSLLAAFASTCDASDQEASACVVLGTENISFRCATQPTDPEYSTIETASYKGVRFCLKAGHGVARLEP